MLFPLPANTIPTLSLHQDDQDALKTLARAFVDDALVEYRAFRDPFQNEEIDTKRWKCIKKRGGLASYLDRKMGDFSASRTAVSESVGTMSFSRTLHGVLTVGTIDGSLHDQMYGLHHCSPELMRIKSAYMADMIADCKMLCEISAATPERPVDGLYIKWSVSDFAPPLLRKLLRPRDFVYLDGTGFIKDDVTGEKIGYKVLHSLQIPGVRELEEYQIVRATLSACALFRQIAPGKVGVYIKGFADTMGSMYPSIAVPVTAETLMSYRKGVYCGQMKKLYWFLKTKKTGLLDRTDGICSLCQSTAKKALSSAHICQVCMSQVCHSCSFVHKLAFLQSASRTIIRRNMAFCARCLRTAALADGLEIASEELRQLNPLERYEFSSSGSGTPASPSNSTLPDIEQEFFG